MQQKIYNAKEIIITIALYKFLYFCLLVIDLKIAVVIIEIKAPIVISK